VKSRTGIRTAVAPSLLLLAGYALSSCTMNGSYHRPDIALPAQYRGSIAADSSSIATMPYREFFGDKRLVALIDSAVAGNLDLQVALQNIDYARQSAKVAKLGYLPTLSIGADASLSRPSDNGSSAITGSDKSVEDYSAEGSLSWEADIWGKIRSRKKSALAAYLKTREAARAVQTRLVADVADSYYSLLMLDAQLDISRKNLALADTTLRMVRLQYDAGQVTFLAVQQQEASRSAIALAIPELERQVSARENAISILTGHMPSSVERGEPLFQEAVHDNLPAGVPASLLENRPDVKAAELGMREAHANAGAALASLYPSFTLTAEGGLNAFRASDWFSTPGSLFGVVQGAVLQPIFQQGRLHAEFRQTKIRSIQAELAFRQTILLAVGEVSDALVQLRALQTREVEAASRATTLQQAVDNSDLLFQSGLATYLEVIIAQNASLGAQLELADIRRQHLSSMAELYRALGGGWKSSQH